MRRRRTKVGPLPVALLSIVVLLGITFVAFNGGLPFRHGARYHAIVDNANALRVRSPVRIAGVAVGKVTGISRGPGHTAKIDMELTANALPIHRDASLRIKPRLFVEGGFYVALSPGSPSGPVLAQGGTIPLGRTRSAVQIAEVLSTFDRPIRRSLRNVIGTTAGALSHGGAEGLAQANHELPPALKDVALATQALRGRRAGDVTTAIAGTASVAGAVADRRDDLAGAVSALGTTARALASSDGALGVGIQRADELLIATPPALTALDRALPHVRRFSRLLDPQLRTLPPVVRSLDGAVRDFGRLVASPQRERVIAAVRATFLDFPDLLTSLTALLPIAKPTTDCVSARLSPILTSSVQDGDLTTGQPAWKEIAHVLPSLAGAGQDFDANGYFLRYQAGAGNQTVGLGTLTGSSPSDAGLSGVRPVWDGTLPASALRSDVPCTTQPLPDLAATAGRPTPARRRATTAKPLSIRALRSTLKAAQRQAAHR